MLIGYRPSCRIDDILDRLIDHERSVMAAMPASRLRCSTSP
jgi:hypothetical protein